MLAAARTPRIGVMNVTGSVDQDAVLRARTMLLGSGRLSDREEADACRVLADVSPAVYLPRLVRALLTVGYGGGPRSRPQDLLAVLEEAVAAAHRIEPAEPRRGELLTHVLDTYQRELCDLGRRAEALAVREELASVARLEHRAGRSGALEGLRVLAAGLAEEGRHRQAADLYGEVVRAGDASQGRHAVGTWTVIEWAAELEAAGAYAEAADVFADVPARCRAELGEGRGSLPGLVLQLVRLSQLLDVGGRREEADAARREALAVLTGLAQSGERPGGGAHRSEWVLLLTLGGRADEPASPHAPAPPFGSLVQHGWSPDVRRRYLDGARDLRCELAVLAPLAELAPQRQLARMVTLHRRLTMRIAVATTIRTHQVLEPLLPTFDRGVALARRLAAVDAVGGRAALAVALTDRSTLLVVGGRHDEALADFTEATELSRVTGSD